MLSKTLFYSLLLISLSHAELFTEYFENGIIKSEIVYKDGTRTPTEEGIKEGMEKIYHDNGKIAYTVNNIDGKRDGNLNWYDKEGNNIEVMPYKMGKRHGTNKLFYSNGTLKSEVNYINDKKEGIEKFYFSTGALAQESQYINDKKEGEEKEYYEDGSLQSIVTYKNNYKEGTKKWFDKNGKVTKTELYKMDRPVNVMKKIQTPDHTETIEEFKVLDFNPQNRRPE
ncbi:toxin-antitoxin system YwqK family antitoxin [Sulfurovum sp. zt1-1]|uniref:Toxin-antitoxin system YwqK family antitoxin n=1 Tax=Sulfurovum zhangzhouensis TaxID=3019067 RepID=A0ABT7QYE2_9BACT|nr:toxin-antitoxin system YwqK family antitoxin [Sulfurovum zhangzhouensis]MDM5271857.1 toxin-antitoxin system YwqK family antitoxin [Sulfurovum zhangzhouensis]